MYSGSQSWRSKWGTVVGGQRPQAGGEGTVLSQDCGVEGLGAGQRQTRDLQVSSMGAGQRGAEVLLVDSQGEEQNEGWDPQAEGRAQWTQGWEATKRLE